MARVKDVGIKIIKECINQNIEINYFKLQKLAYICQCIHYARFQVSLVPETIYYWSLGAGFKELYYLFYKYKLFSDINGTITNNQLEKSHLKNKLLDIVSFEKETIDFVLSKYGKLDTQTLIDLSSTSIPQNIKIGSSINIENLNNYFAPYEEIRSVSKTLKQVCKK